MENEIAISETQQMKRDLEGIKLGPRGFEIATVSELVAMIKVAMQSRIVPSDCKSMADALIRVQHGMCLGLDPMRSLQSVYVVNNRPCLWGSAVAGIIQSSGKCKVWRIKVEGEGDKAKATLVTERNDIAGENEFEYSMADAKTAGLLGKGPWSQHPKDMLRAKVIARAAKNLYADILSGIGVVEDEQDAIDATAVAVSPEDGIAQTLEQMADELEGESSDA